MREPDPEPYHFGPCVAREFFKFVECPTLELIIYARKYTKNTNGPKLCLQQCWTLLIRRLVDNYQIFNMPSTPTVEFPMLVQTEKNSEIFASSQSFV